MTDILEPKYWVVLIIMLIAFEQNPFPSLTNLQAKVWDQRFSR